MSLMLKLLLSTILLSSLAIANSSSEAVEDFLEESISKNPNVESLEATVVDKIKVEEVNGWDAYVVEIRAVLKKGKRKIKQKMIWFSDGKVIVKELTLMSNGSKISDSIKPPFKVEYYTKEHLIYGNVNAKHKVVIFSDPLCPFCRNFVPAAISYMKKHPNKFAIYYFHFPLPAIHPASVTLVKAEIAAVLQGNKEVLLDLYKVKVNPKEKDIKKILTAFNKATGLNISKKDINSKDVIYKYNENIQIAEDMMVQGTPTMFFDGKLDITKNKFKKIK